MVQIEILTGPESGKVVDFSAGSHRIGRASGNALVIADASVSGKHLELVVGDDGAVRFRDLGSTNGTWSGGVQVQDGEWFVGTELKLGGCSLRLVDASGAAEEADAALHRRAREAAMEGGRRGGPLQLVLVLVLVAAAGGAAWWVLGGGEDGVEEGTARAGSPGEPGAQVVYDLVDNLGDFSNPDPWALSEGLSIADGALTADGGGRATLARNFPAVPALRFSAETDGLAVTPMVAWGQDGSDAPIGHWAAASLDSGTAASQVPLPDGADWFRVEMDVQGRGTLRGLKVEEAEASVRSGDAPGGELASYAGNWLLSGPQGMQLAVRAAQGEWQPAAGGEDFAAEGGVDVLVRAGAALLEDGSFLVLGAGGPVGLAPGVVVEDSPGLLLGGENGRFLLRFEPAASVRAAEGGALVSGVEGMTLRWDLQADLLEAARLSRSIADHERTGDDRALLETVSRLLRSYPLVDAQVIDALQRSRASMQRGRAELAELQTATGAALFVASLEGMEGLSARAAALAARYPGTDIDREAADLADVLGSRAREVRAARDAEANAYRERLLGALQGSYPLLAAWLAEEGR